MPLGAVSGNKASGRSGFKKGIDAEDRRKKREDARVSVRKQQREEALMKKRRDTSAPGTDAAAAEALTSLGASVTVPGETGTVEERLTLLPSMAESINCADPERQLTATTWFRKLLSIERNPPIDNVVEAGVVPRLVELLTFEAFPKLQFEAAWALTNIASGTTDNTAVVINHGSVPIFIQLLSSPSEDVREQAVWALGNIAGDSPEYRDMVLSHGIVEPLMGQINDQSRLTMIRNATWALSNLCRGKPQPDFEAIRATLPCFAFLITYDDEEVITDACWALSYATDGPNEKIQAVLECGVVERLVELLAYPSPSVQTPALRAVGNIVTGNDVQTQAVINAGALPQFLNLLPSHNKKSLRKETCWAISNINGGTPVQIASVLQAGLVPAIIDVLNTADFDIKKEAAWAISNATCGGGNEAIQFLVEQGCAKPFCDLLGVQDTRIVNVALEGIENILKMGAANEDEEGDNPMCIVIEEAEGLEKLEELQTHANDEVYQRAVRMLETYFGEDESDDEEDGPQIEEGASAYSFGAAASTGTELGQPMFNFGGGGFQ